MFCILIKLYFVGAFFYGWKSEGAGQTFCFWSVKCWNVKHDADSVLYSNSISAGL